jgi:putative mycofactocin binding protein MftB
VTTSTVETEHPVLSRRLEVDPRTSLRPEPFGALAYHSENRRLVFLRHRDLLVVVESLADHDDVAAALAAAGVDQTRWNTFAAAIESLINSEMLRDRTD